MIPGLFLFDLDGTLVDTAPDLGGAVNDMRIARGLEPLPLDLLREPAGHGAPKLLKAAFNMETTDEAYPAMRAGFLKNYAARGVSHSPLFAGIRELLEALREMHVPMGVVTNKPQELADRVCRELDLSDFMEVVIGLGPEGTKLKPAPDSLLLALKRTGIPAEKTLYAGDNTKDALAAQAAGMPFAFVAWGCQQELPDRALYECAARTPADLLSWMLRR